MSNGTNLLHNVRRVLRQLISPTSTTPSLMAIMEGPLPPKLHGRAFYESIGSPKLILAPMVDRSEFVSTHFPKQEQDNLTEYAGMEAAHPVLPR